ncbi:MAG: 50S ribosomal protein L11 methyltransferase [Porticoccaceae bacterium]|nr:50S ribosomal protein L11 methyltransferase [Porticoccaceae bacterium]
MDQRATAAASSLEASFTLLESYLQQRIPGSRLEAAALPQVPELRLYLINSDYPRDGLSREQAEALMDNPPYWAFCWASGQVLARLILDNPQWVSGKTLVDFGAGSGVVGIAAKMAGAQRVILCDLDSQALAVAELNAALCGVNVELSTSLDDIVALKLENSLVTVADVFYDRDNLPLLASLQTHFTAVLVADSRLKGQPLPRMDIIARHSSHTVPDLDESVEFNRVVVYKSR